MEEFWTKSQRSADGAGGSSARKSRRCEDREPRPRRGGILAIYPHRGRTSRTLVGTACGRAVGLVDISVALECVSGRVRDQRRAQLICEYARLVVFCRRVAQPLRGRGKRDVGRAESSHPIGGTRNGAGVGTVCERRRSLDDESGEGGGHINHNTPGERTAPQTRSQGARTKVAARPGEEGWRTCALGRNAK